MRECPDENEFGVRDFPVCVDEVDPNKYQNLTEDTDTFTTAELISVSREGLWVGLFGWETYLCVCVCVCVCVLQDLLDDIANERCAPYYLRSTAGI